MLNLNRGDIFAHIIADEKANRSILEIKSNKMNDGNTRDAKTAKLTLEKIGELMFDIIKLNPSQYITRETIIFEGHEVTARLLSSEIV